MRRHYPLWGRGDVRTEQVFAELSLQLIGPSGRVGILVPTGVIADKAAEAFVEVVIFGQRLISAFDFENREGLFPDVRPHQRFVALTASGRCMPDFDPKYSFNLSHPQDINSDTLVPLRSDDILTINPNSRTLPVAPSSRDLRILRDVYRGVPPFINIADDDNPWGASFLRMFDMASDSTEFRTASDLENLDCQPGERSTWRCGDRVYVPLFDAKMAGQFNHRAASLAFGQGRSRKIRKKTTAVIDLKNPDFFPTPVYWVKLEEVRERSAPWTRQWFLGFKDVSGRTSRRLSKFSFIPYQGVGHPFPLLMLAGNAEEHCFVAALFNSILIEYVLRLKMQGLHLTYFLLKQLPVVPPGEVNIHRPWMQGSLLNWISMRVLELSYTSQSMAPLAAELGWTGNPFPWNSLRRRMILREIDAAMFVVYKVSRDDVEYILDQLDKIKRRDEQKFGKFVTKTTVLAMFDDMTRAAEEGSSYVTKESRKNNFPFSR